MSAHDLLRACARISPERGERIVSAVAEAMLLLSPGGGFVVAAITDGGAYRYIALADGHELLIIADTLIAAIEERICLEAASDDMRTTLQRLGRIREAIGVHGKPASEDAHHA